MVKRVKKGDIVVDNEVDYYTRELDIISPSKLEKLKRRKKETPKEIEKVEVENNSAKRPRIPRIISFTLLLFLVAGFMYFCTYWYVELYKKEDGGILEVVTKKVGYSFVSYETKNDLEMLNDTYILETKDNVLYKVLNKAGKVLFDDNIDYTSIYMDLNNDLYVVNNSDSEYGNLLSLYKLANEKFELVNDYSEVGYQYNLIVYNDGNNKYLYGLSKMSHVFEETENVNKIIMLDGETEITLDKNVYLGNIGDKDIEVRSTRYMPVNNLTSVGLYDFTEKSLAINYNYQSINFVDVDNEVLLVSKNNKYALLDLNLKKVLDYKYEFVEYHNDYILVGSNNKIGVMDKDYNLLVSPVIPYEYNMDNIKIDSYKIGDNLVINIEKDNLGIISKETYIIKSDKTVNKIEDEYISKDEFSYTVSSDKMKYNIYDKDNMFIGTVDLTGYDFDNVVELNKVGDTLVVNGNLFYDFATLKQVDELQEYKLTREKYELILGTDGKVNIYIGTKNIGSYKYEYGYKLENQNGDDTFYYLSNNSYVAIKKVN